MNKTHQMTEQDRRVLAALLEKLMAFHSIRDNKRFMYFVEKAKQEARKRNAPHYYDRFSSIELSAKLAYEAYRPRLQRMGAVASGRKRIKGKQRNES